MHYTLYFIVFSLIILCFSFTFRRILLNLPKLIYWLIYDRVHHSKDTFPYYGCWFFVGKQGAGKTISMVEQLEHFRKEYPKIKIYTNMGYKYETAPLKSLNDLLNRRLYNGEFGTIFVIDEIQNEFSASTSKDFPESVLSLVTQQRKNHILILTTSQVFTRVSKPLREQCYRAIECRTIFGRYTMCKHYDGIEYADAVDKSIDYKAEHRPRLEYHSFVQSNKLRNCFDSYLLIDRLSRVGFSPKIVDNTTVNINVASTESRIARRAMR